MIDKIIEIKIKETVRIEDVVGDFVQLRKHGVNLEGLCPFHEDRHLGNFFVSPSKNICYCFACGCGENKALDSIGFLMKLEHLTYEEALRWIAAKYNIYIDEDNSRWADKVKRAQPKPPPPPKEPLTLPIEMVKKTQDTTSNTLCNWIRSLDWDSAQRERVERAFRTYMVGHGKDGHTIFWQANEKGTLLTGKMMLYKKDGHRDKDTFGNFSWIHSRLAKAGFINLDTHDALTTYFGMHLVDMCPMATINLVESEKTALIMTIAYGGMSQSLWLATGGLSNITPAKLRPLIERKRHIVLYPDRDSVDKWRSRMDTLGYEHMTLNADIITKCWKPEDGEKADIADIIVRMVGSQQPKITTVEDTLKIYPQLKPLHEAVCLELITIKDENSQHES